MSLTPFLSPLVILSSARKLLYLVLRKDMNLSLEEERCSKFSVCWEDSGQQVKFLHVNVSLKMLYFFHAFFSAVYCSPVPQIANGFAISSTNVSYAGTAKYSCYDGFAFPSGKKTEEIICTEDGRWTPVPQCKAATCPALIPFHNGERKLLFGDGTGFGTVYSFECAPGYKRKGAPTILCQSSGLWSAVQPRCQSKFLVFLYLLSSSKYI